MAKSKIKITFEPIIIISMILVSGIILLLQKFFPQLTLQNIFIAPSSPKGNLSFSFSEPLSYFRIFLHIFGNRTFTAWSCFSILLLLSNDIETEYGTLFLSVMMILATIFSGVLSACFCINSISGIEPIFCLMISLKIIDSLKKKKLPVYVIAIALIYIFSKILDSNRDIISLFINIAGGLCGSLICFLTIPKKKKSAAPKRTLKPVSSKDDDDDDDDPYSDKYSPRFRRQNYSSNNSDDETVVGTLQL